MEQPETASNALLDVTSKEALGGQASWTRDYCNSPDSDVADG